MCKNINNAILFVFGYESRRPNPDAYHGALI